MQEATWLVQKSGHMTRGRAMFSISQQGSPLIRPVQERKMFDTIYKTDDPQLIFKRCRTFAAQQGFPNFVISTKKLLFNHGLHFLEREDADVPPAPIEPEGDPALESTVQRCRQMINDMWLEWLVCENAVAVWVQSGDNESGAIPFVHIVDCEGVKYRNDFGHEFLYFKFQPRALTPEQKQEMPSRIVEALEQGKEIRWGEQADEKFKVLTQNKAGNGLAKPRLWANFQDLGIHNLLTNGDWNAAMTAKDVIRQIKKGHEITGGAMAGLPTHFMRAEDRDQINKAMQDKTGAFDAVTNFDVEFAFPKFDFEFFAADKYIAVKERLVEWGGPLGQIFVAHASTKGSDNIEHLLLLLQAEMETHRELIGGFFRSIVTQPGFEACADFLPDWSPITLIPFNALLKFCLDAQGQGLMSSITARGYLRLDNEKEKANLRIEHATPEDYSPAFEASQGLTKAGGKEGGRPPGVGSDPDPTIPTP